MLHYNKQTGKWEMSLPVDTKCMGTKEGCPASNLRKISPEIESLVRSSQDVLMMNYDDALMQLFPELAKPAPMNFDDIYDLKYDEVIHITTAQAMSLNRLDVVLVRSRSLPEAGDHYIVIMGHGVVKDHGLRPQTAVFPAIQNSPLLDMYDSSGSNVVLLKLNKTAQDAFLRNYGIHMDVHYNIVSDNVKLEMV